MPKPGLELAIQFLKINEKLCPMHLNKENKIFKFVYQINDSGT